VAESNCRLTESIHRPENQRFMPTSTRLDFEAVEHSDRDELLTNSKVAVAHGNVLAARRRVTTSS
jgi:hypothetical protein